MLFLELSFLFDDARIASKAVGKRDLKYVLRMHERLADLGSEAAGWNAERLSLELGVNESQ